MARQETIMKIQMRVNPQGRRGRRAAGRRGKCGKRTAQKRADRFSTGVAETALLRILRGALWTLDHSRRFSRK